MIDLRYSLVIEATEEPDFFSFYSPDLEGFSGVGHSIEDCLYKTKWGIAEHVRLLEEQGLPSSTTEFAAPHHHRERAGAQTSGLSGVSVGLLDRMRIVTGTGRAPYTLIPWRPGSPEAG